MCLNAANFQFFSPFQIGAKVASITTSFKRSTHETTYLNEQGDTSTDRAKTHPLQPKKKTPAWKKSLPPLHGVSQKGLLRELDVVTGLTSPAGSFTEGTEARKAEKFKPLNKKTLLRRSLLHKHTKGGVKPVSPGASTRQSLVQECSEYGEEWMRKPLSQLRERHTEESLFPHLTSPAARGNPAIAPIKPHPTSLGYMQYLADLIPGDAADGDESKSRSRNQKFLPPIDPTTHKGRGHSGQVGTVTFNSVDSVDPSMPGVSEYLDLNYRSGSRNVSQSIYWSKTIGKSGKLRHNLKNSGLPIEGSSVAAGGRVSRILKKVLVSMENKQ